MSEPIIVQPQKHRDEDLLRAIIQHHDHKAYRILIDKYTSKIWRLALSILRDEQEAEDAVQDVLLSLWQNLDKWDLEGRAQFSTWIYRVAFNKCIDIKRKHKHKFDADDLELPSGEKNAYQNTLQKELSAEVGKLISSLPLSQRQALQLYYYEELSILEISTHLKRSEQSIRSLLKRGKASLREKVHFVPSFESFDMAGLSQHLWR